MGKYSGTLMDHFFAPRNAGRMDSPDRCGRAGSATSGLLLVVQLRLREDRVAEARFPIRRISLMAANSTNRDPLPGRKQRTDLVNRAVVPV
jgi:hypothetical protein